MTVEIYSNNSEQQTMVGNPVQFVADDSSPVDNFTASVKPSLNGVSSVQVTNNGRVTTAPLGRTLYAGTANITDGLITATYDGQLYNPSAIPADLNSIILANTEEKTASGDIASFNCQLGEYPVKDLTVDIEPVQDLHGYDHPWPAGGGKNLYNANALNSLSNSGITGTVSNGTITFNGTATANAFFSVSGTGLPSGNYVFTFNNPVASSGVHVSFQNSGNQYFSDTRANAVNKSVAFTGEPTNILLYVNSGTTLTDFVVKPQLETGSTATSWEPYENICPITGWTECKVTRTGKNLLPPQNIVGSMSDVIVSSDGDIVTLNGTASAYGQVVSDSTFTLKAGTYYLMPFIVSGSGIAQYQLRSTNGQTVYVQTDAGKSKSFTLSEDTEVKARVTYINGAVISNLKIQAMLVSGSTAPASFAPFVSTTYPIPLGQTVYGGTLDVVNGKMTVEWAKIVYNGSETWYPYGTQGYYIARNDMAKATQYKGILKSDILPTYQSNYGGDFNAAQYGIVGWDNLSSPNQNYIYVKCGEVSATDQTVIKAWLQENPLTVTYELATPITITLDPVTISTISGQNNIWADCGPSTVEYRNGRINETSVLTQSNALISGEQVTYPLSLPIILSGNRTPIYTYPGENNMSANVNSFSVTWSKHWFDITPWIAWQGLTFSRNDVDAPNAGRDMSGYMHRGRVASKEKMNIQTVQLTRAQSSKLQTLLFPETIMVRVTPYPRTNAMQVLYMYSNNVKTTYVIHRESGEDLQSLSFPLIEN